MLECGVLRRWGYSVGWWCIKVLEVVVLECVGLWGVRVCRKVDVLDCGVECWIVLYLC